MVEIYVSWCPGLETNDEALRILKDCKLISGIEVWNHDLKGNIKKNGLKLSIHNPIKKIMCDLTDDNLEESLSQHKEIVDAMISSDSKIAGFHVYYKAYAVYKHLKDGISLKGIDLSIKSPEELAKKMISNLLMLEKLINQGIPDKKKKFILFETWPYFDFASIVEEGTYIKPEFQNLGEAAAVFNTPQFIKKILDDKKVVSNGRIGFLFDASHIFCAANNIIMKKKLSETPDNYIDKIINACRGRIHQLHLGVPVKRKNRSYFDIHGAFIPGDALSESIINTGRKVLLANPHLSTITLEIDTHTNPVAHAKKLVEQVLLISKELNLEQ
jgi:sugar phosphate isomerase/epimerase